MDVSGEAISAGATGGCEWTATGSGFAPLTGASSFSGSGTALFAISANTSTSARSTTVLVAGRSVVVNQAGAGEPGPDPGPQSPGEPVDTETVYFHTDAIGSVRMVTDASGAVLHRYDYSPDGALVSQEGSGVPWNRRSWAGKERDAETAAGATQPLDYFGARSYAQQLGRFTAVDPVLVIEDALGDPQRWNRYGYGMNNPLRYVDPDGRYVFHCGTLAAEACAEARTEFEKARQEGLSSKSAPVQDAARAYGDPDKDNGVTVTMRSPTELGGKAGLTVMQRRDGRVFIDVGLSTDASSHGGFYSRTVAHEGEHVRLDMGVIAGAELTLGASERSAYQVGAEVMPYDYRLGGVRYRFGPRDTAAIRRFVDADLGADVHLRVRPR